MKGGKIPSPPEPLEMDAPEQAKTQSITATGVSKSKLIGIKPSVLLEIHAMMVHRPGGVSSSTEGCEFNSIEQTLRGCFAGSSSETSKLVVQVQYTFG